MKTVELYARVRHAVLIEGISERAAADRFGINARTVSKMLKFSVPPGYVRRKPPFRPKLDEFSGVIDAILASDKDRPKKQRHTSKRIFERLRDEHGFTGKITIVKDYVAGWRQRTQEMFVPLVHPPGHAQADFGVLALLFLPRPRDCPLQLRRGLRRRRREASRFWRAMLAHEGAVVDIHNIVEP